MSALLPRRPAVIIVWVDAGVVRVFTEPHTCCCCGVQRCFWASRGGRTICTHCDAARVAGERQLREMAARCDNCGADDCGCVTYDDRGDAREFDDVRRGC